jgi:hypothetical protein
VTSLRSICARVALVLAAGVPLTGVIVYNAEHLSSPAPAWLQKHPASGLTRAHDAHYQDDAIGKKWLSELYGYAKENGTRRSASGQLEFYSTNELETLFRAHVNALDASGVGLDIPWQGVKMDMTAKDYSLVGGVNQGNEQSGDVTLWEGSTPQHLRLYIGTAQGHGVRLDAAPGQKPSFAPEFLGSGLSGLHLALLILSSIAGLIWLCWAGNALLFDIPDDVSALRDQRRSRRQMLAAWRKLVPSEAIGPSEPEDDYTIYQAERKEQETGDDIIVSFQVVRYRWHWYGWHVTGSNQKMQQLAKSLKTSFKMSEGYPAVMEGWIDFCAAVAVLNAEEWQARQAPEPVLDEGALPTLRSDLALLPSAQQVQTELRLHELVQ